MSTELSEVSDMYKYVQNLLFHSRKGGTEQANMRTERIIGAAGSSHHLEHCVSRAALCAALLRQEKQKCANISAQSGDGRPKARAVQFRAVPVNVRFLVNYAK